MNDKPEYYACADTMTPPKGESMPQTQEYWQKRAQMDQELILEYAARHAKDTSTINDLRQKLNKGKK